MLAAAICRDRGRLRGDSGGRETVAAPKRCIDSWNRDQAALAYGRHNFSFHLYDGALVTYLTNDGREVGEGEGGLCAVIFPSKALDPEPFAAGQVLRGKLWFPISELEGMELSRLAELQVLAQVAEYESRRPGPADSALIASPAVDPASRSRSDDHRHPLRLVLATACAVILGAAATAFAQGENRRGPD